MNSYALGRNVAGGAVAARFISARESRHLSDVHCAFRRWLQLPHVRSVASRALPRRICIRRRIRSQRAIGPARWNLFRRAARQFFGLRGFAGLAHRRRDLGLRIAGRNSRRRLGRRARCRGWNLGRLDRHHIETLRFSPRSGRVSVTAAAAIFT